MDSGTAYRQAQLFAAVLRGSLTSGFRTAFHNAAVGGVAHSAHLFGVGFDIVYDAPVPLAEAVDVARRLGFALRREADHDHLQPLAWRPG